MSAEVGQPAPELTLINNERQPVTLADIKGKTTVLAFFPGAFTGGCQQEACTFRDALSEYNNLGAQVYGISVDSFFAQNAFVNENNLNFPFLGFTLRLLSLLRESIDSGHFTNEVAPRKEGFFLMPPF